MNELTWEAVGEVEIVSDQCQSCSLLARQNHLANNIAAVRLQPRLVLQPAQHPFRKAKAHTVDTDGWAALYAFGDLFRYVEVVEVEWLCTDQSSFGQSLGLIVDGDDTLSASKQSSIGGEEADGAAAPHYHSRARLHLTQLCAVIALTAIETTGMQSSE